MANDDPDKPACRHSAYWTWLDGKWKCPMCDPQVVLEIIGSKQPDDEPERA